jgi:2-dehydropantoate 2-reductase
MNILILGAGAIGSAFGGFLAKSGNRVIFFGRENCISAINSRGLFIEGIWGSHHITNLKGYSSLSKIARLEGRLFDLVLLTVKSYDTDSVMHTYLNTFGKSNLTVSLQNGLGNVEIVSALMGKEKTIGGRVIFGAELLEPGIVKITVYADKVVLGSLKGGVPLDKVQEVCRLFDKAGIPTTWTSEIEKFIWGKVFYNSALNALSCLLEVSYGELLNNEYARMIMQDIVDELFTVIHRNKIPLDWDSADAYITHLFTQLIPPTRDHYSSMLQDIRHGKRTEIDALNGKVVSLAEESACDLPVNRVLTALVKAKRQ